MAVIVVPPRSLLEEDVASQMIGVVASGCCRQKEWADKKSGPTKRAVIGDRPDLNRAWEEDKPVRLVRMMRLLG
ncbi:MAG: hypothetical protein E5V85_04745 [Mesorhizobium sp.]|uniref:hypothetical protein n=1 Tax=Mesorhizobium sp. TaxID=1871066 RepID=UPI000FE9C744|nr:hypothetical protein [Mesorhizobium sp.]RWD59443.1 MAG: hypothetical protein EOS36_25165 [Mesorhizobium sp.]RWE49406.1 MAG: hypothetical protein EOS79_07005 [Mesorhizobium sp.]TIW00232.1 MAG: hypothetical protein E5V85_04745 [Mesorhizobium sp.]